MYDLIAKKYTQLSTFNGEDRNPVFDANNSDFYYLSEQSGSFNVYKSSIASPAKSTPVTKFIKHPVRFLTRSKTGTLCFSYNGELYTQKGGSEPVQVSVRVAADGRDAIEKIVPVNGGFTEAKLSPNGKEFAFIFRGEIFVSSIDGKTTKRITNTPYQERSVSFSPDGRSLAYAAEKDNNWNIYTVTISRKEEPYFYVSTVFKEEAVVATPAERVPACVFAGWQGKSRLSRESAQTLKVMDALALNNRERSLVPIKTIHMQTAINIISGRRTGKWFLVQYGLPDRIQTPEVGLVAADGKSEVHNLTQSGYDDVVPKWAMDGKMMIWGSTRDGALAQGGGSVSDDVYGMYFSKALFDRSKLSKEEAALLKRAGR